MTMTLGELKSFFQMEREASRRHALVAHYLLQTLEERHERLILALIVAADPAKVVTRDHLSRPLLLEYIREGRSPSWINQALEKLQGLKLIVFTAPRNGSTQWGYALAEDASSLREWWNERVWKEDGPLGLVEWLHPTKLLVSP